MGVMLREEKVDDGLAGEGGYCLSWMDSGSDDEGSLVEVLRTGDGEHFYVVI